MLREMLPRRLPRRNLKVRKQTDRKVNFGLRLFAQSCEASAKSAASRSRAWTPREDERLKELLDAQTPVKKMMK